MERKVFIVDDDAGLRDSLQWLLESEGMLVETFESAAVFLDKVLSYADDIASVSNNNCLITDVCMPGMDGLELQSFLIEKNIDIPMIFISGQCTPDMIQTALDKGAVEYRVRREGESRDVALDEILEVLTAG